MAATRPMEWSFRTFLHNYRTRGAEGEWGLACPKEKAAAFSSPCRYGQLPTQSRRQGLSLRSVESKKKKKLGKYVGRVGWILLELAGCPPSRLDTRFFRWICRGGLPCERRPFYSLLDPHVVADNRRHTVGVKDRICEISTPWIRQKV